MKKNIIILCAILCLMMLSLTGCRLTHYNRKEAVEYLKELFPDESIHVSFFYRTRPSERNYKNRVWQVRFKDQPKLVFEVVSNEGYGRESVEHWLTTNYNYVYGKYYFEQYLMSNNTAFTVGDSKNILWLKAGYSNRKELDAVVNDTWNIDQYMKSQNRPVELVYEFKFLSPLDKVSEEYDTRYWTDSIGSTEQLLEKVTTSYALYCADYRLNNISEFTYTELKHYITLSDRSDMFQIIRTDGTSEAYDDLILNGPEISFGALYEVLSRNGFRTEGTPEKFSAIGINNDIYEFSYSYNDYYFDESDKLGYYYMKNGEKIPMKYYHKCHFNRSFLEEISGISFSSIP